jgi:putative NADH-flavin reductase
MLVYVLAAFLIYATVLSLALWRSGFRHSSSRGAPDSLSPTRTPIERLLIVGGTGGTGRRLISQALERGLTVTALLRDPDKLTIDDPNLTKLQGDVLDPASVNTAMSGQDAVISTLGHKRFFYPTRILSRGTANLISGLETNGIRRFVCQTSLGIGDSAGRMGVYYTFFTIPLILPFYFWDKTRQERLIAGSSLDWVIVRPGLLNDSDKHKEIRHGRRVGNHLTTVRISRSDVASFLLDQLDSDEYV